jgi:hypothetical protein
VNGRRKTSEWKNKKKLMEEENGIRGRRNE